MARAGLTVERVTLAAAELADAEGFHAVTVSVLARQLGVRTPSLYSHVAGNPELRLRLLALALTEAADRAEAACAGLTGHPALEAYADTWRCYAHAHPGRYAATRQPVPVDGTAAAEAALAAGRRHADLLTAAVELPAGERAHGVRLVGSVVHGFVSLELAGGFAHSAPDADASWRFALDGLRRALQP